MAKPKFPASVASTSQYLARSLGLNEVGLKLPAKPSLTRAMATAGTRPLAPAIQREGAQADLPNLGIPTRAGLGPVIRQAQAPLRTESKPGPVKKADGIALLPLAGLTQAVPPFEPILRELANNPEPYVCAGALLALAVTTATVAIKRYRNYGEGTANADPVRQRSSDTVAHTGRNLGRAALTLYGVNVPMPARQAALTELILSDGARGDVSFIRPQILRLFSEGSNGVERLAPADRNTLRAMAMNLIQNAWLVHPTPVLSDVLHSVAAGKDVAENIRLVALQILVSKPAEVVPQAFADISSYSSPDLLVRTATALARTRKPEAMPVVLGFSAFECGDTNLHRYRSLLSNFQDLPVTDPLAKAQAEWTLLHRLPIGLDKQGTEKKLVAALARSTSPHALSYLRLLLITEPDRFGDSVAGVLSEKRAGHAKMILMEAAFRSEPLVTAAINRAAPEAFEAMEELLTLYQNGILRYLSPEQTEAFRPWERLLLNGFPNLTRKSPLNPQTPAQYETIVRDRWVIAQQLSELGLPDAFEIAREIERRHPGRF